MISRLFGGERFRTILTPVRFYRFVTSPMHFQIVGGFEAFRATVALKLSDWFVHQHVHCEVFVVLESQSARLTRKPSFLPVSDHVRVNVFGNKSAYAANAGARSSMGAFVTFQPLASH